MRATRILDGIAAVIAAGFAFAQPAMANVFFELITGPPSAQSLVVDSNKCPTEGPIAMYVAGQITNTGAAPAANVEATISGLSGAFALTGAQTPTLSIGTIAPGAAIVAGWHIAYPCTNGATVNLTISTTASTGSDTDTIALTVRTAQSANAGGNVLSTTLGAGAVVGQTITADVQFGFGNIGTGDEFFLQPAGNTTFDAACLRLVRTEITASNINALPVGATNTLYAVSPNKQAGSGYTTTVRFSFRYLCAGVSSVARPYSAQTSGATNIKYTGNFDGASALNFSFPTSTNPFTISKSVAPGLLLHGSGPHSVTYTVTVSNPSAFASVVDGFTDILPAGVAYAALHPSSGVTIGNSGSVPAAGATGAISFNGVYETSYALPPGGSLGLVYTSTVHDVLGSYVNSVVARIGAATVGPATATTTVSGSSLAVSKTVAVHDPSSLGLFATPGNDVIYTIRVENTGAFAADSDSLVIVDVMPPEIEFRNEDFSPNAPVSPFEFNSGPSAVVCCAATDIQYSSSASAPAIFGYVPGPGYDPAVNFIRINPKGSLAPGAWFEIQFRSRIR